MWSFFPKCPKFYLDFKNTIKKNQLHNLIIPEVIDPKKCGHLNAWKLFFQNVFRIQQSNASQTLFKPARQRHCPTLIADKFSWKTSVLVRLEILAHLFNTLTAYHMYSGQDWEKFLQQIPTILSSKPKTFPLIFIAFLKTT